MNIQGNPGGQVLKTTDLLSVSGAEIHSSLLLPMGFYIIQN
jgi:hypothetical protein